MSSRETRLQRGRRRGRMLTARALEELRATRDSLGVGLPAMSRELDCSASQLWRRLAGEVGGVSVIRLAEMASVLGLELSLGLHPIGDPIRDRGQQALAGRLRQLIDTAWQVTAETPLPGTGDWRAWDLLLRVPGQLVGVELETRIRDVQALARRIHLRERDGGVDVILVVLSDSAANGRLAGQLREALGPAYATSRRSLLRALRAGLALPGPGVVLL